MAKNKLKILLDLFKDDTGGKVVLTPGQWEIFQTIAQRTHPRSIVLGYTQYGKSFTISLALILRLTALKEKWIILSGTKRQARVIGTYVIGHLFDNPLFTSQLISDTSLDRLKAERSKDRLTFRNGGELMILTGDARNKQESGNALMEFGSPNLIIDGSGLLNDDIYAKAKRMVGGTKDNFIIELGNPFLRNHFHRTWEYDDAYKKIKIDWKQGLAEGRLTQEFISEMKRERLFDILYGCNFPSQDDDSIMQLELLRDVSEDETILEGTPVVLGCDIARYGSDNSVITVLKGARQVEQKIISGQNTMEIAGHIKVIAEKSQAELIGIDVIGVGSGVVDRLLEQKVKGVIPVNFSESAIESGKYSNTRAEAYLNMKGQIETRELAPIYDEKLFEEIIATKVTFDSSGRYKLMEKEKIKELIGRSPDRADALAIAVWTRRKSIYKGNRIVSSVIDTGSDTDDDE